MARSLAHPRAVPPTAEDERRAAEKLAAAAEHRAARKAKRLAGAQVEPAGLPELDETALTDAETPVADSGALSEAPEPQPAAEPAPDADQEAPSEADRAADQARERADLMARADAIGLHTRFNFGPDTSIKILRRKVEDGEAEAQAAERQEAAAPVAVPDDAELEAARTTWQEAEARHHALQVEQAGLPGLIEDAVAAGDYPQVQALRQRKAELPFAIQTAELDACKCKLAYFQLRVPRARAAKIAARRASAEVNAEFEAWKVKTYAAANEAEHAATASDDAVRDVGAIQRELDRLMAELAG